MTSNIKKDDSLLLYLNIFQNKNASYGMFLYDIWEMGAM